MKKFLSLLICSFCLAEDINNIYEEAKKQEELGNYKEAMLLYKKAATLNISKEDTYLFNLKKNHENEEDRTYTTMKKEFYLKQIDRLDDEETEKNLEQIITKDFNIYPYKKNYLLPVNYSFNDIEGRKNTETTFQISLEKPISYNFFGLDESISAAYTQKSFWQTTKDSSPFRETNYEPEIFVTLPYKETSILKAYKFSLLHASNGKNEEESRSWNRLYLEGYFQFSNLFLIPRVWYRIPEEKGSDDNSDIEDYYGYGDLTLLYAYKKHTFELLLRNNLKLNDSNKGAVELNWTFPLPEFLSTKNTYGLLQLFSGYGNNLIDYDREINKIGIGIVFSR